MWGYSRNIRLERKLWKPLFSYTVKWAELSFPPSYSIPEPQQSITCGAELKTNSQWKQIKTSRRRSCKPKIRKSMVPVSRILLRRIFSLQPISPAVKQGNRCNRGCAPFRNSVELFVELRVPRGALAGTRVPLPPPPSSGVGFDIASLLHTIPFFAFLRVPTLANIYWASSLANNKHLGRADELWPPADTLLLGVSLIELLTTEGSGRRFDCSTVPGTTKGT
jgi:hypothetical protein